MAQTIFITLTLAGTDTGPFDLYSNVDGFLVPFETNISKIDLEAGYTSFLVPDAAITLRVQSDSVLCSNYIDLTIGSTTTTTSSSSTTSTSSTTTTTTTLAPEDYDFYLADEYNCECGLQVTNVVVAFPTGSTVTMNRYYATLAPLELVYKVTGPTSPGFGPILVLPAYVTCAETPCIA